MAEYNAQDRVKKMVAAIKSEAKEKADQILEHGQQQFKIEKNKLLNQGKDKIQQEYKIKIDQYSVQKRIQRSAKINESRILKMNTRFDLMNKLKDTLREKLKKTIQSEEAYKILMKKLVIQGLIKLMETDIQLRCLKADTPILESLLEECANDYNQIIRKECKKEMNVKLSIDKNNYLDEKWNNSIGGVMLCCQTGKIICANTLENRLNLAFQESLPDIRPGLFPDLKLPVKVISHERKEHH